MTVVICSPTPVKVIGDPPKWTRWPQWPRDYDTFVRQAPVGIPVTPRNTLERSR